MMRFLGFLATSARTAAALDERRIAYTFSKPLEDILGRGIPKPKHTSGAARLLVFLLRVVKGARLQVSRLQPAQVLFFADSLNQYNSLVAMQGALAAQSLRTAFAVTPAPWNSDNGKLGVTPLYARHSDALLSLVFGCLASPRLWMALRRQPGAPICFFDKILDVHRLLPTFLRTLAETRPRLVVVANDHNTGCRLLASLARRQGIATLYLQHAQVSDHFPPLDYDFVFLDGEAALEAYAGIAVKTKTASPNTRVFLNGEKKTFAAGKRADKGNRIGIGISPIDQPNRVIPLVAAISTQCDRPVVLRPHPATPVTLLRSLEKAFAGHENVTIVPARLQPVGDFLDGLCCLIAGDSSIHIDALLRGVPTFYSSMHCLQEFSDYYGFVRNGVVPTVPEELSSINWDDMSTCYEFPVAAIQKYSASYRTRWQGKEQMLAAMTVQALIAADENALVELYPRTIQVSELGMGIDHVRAPA